MDSLRGATCLGLLPEKLRLTVLQKLANLGSVEPGALVDLTESLRELAWRPNIQGTPIKGGLEKIAAIVNALDPASGQSLLAALGEKDRGLADAVEELLFQFSDLTSLPDKSLVEVLKSVPTETLKLALRTAPELVSQALFRNLSERAQAMLRDDIAAMGLVRLADVENAQKKIADIARRLIDEGKIAGPKDRGDYV
jgi:flagellar motor switch protein FliG